MFSLGNARAAVTSAFGTGAGPDGRDDNVLFGTNGVISRTLTYWESVIRDLFNLVDQLRAELFKMREEMERERKEMREAEKKARAGVAAAEQKASGLQDRLAAATGKKLTRT